MRGWGRPRSQWKSMAMPSRVLRSVQRAVPASSSVDAGTTRWLSSRSEGLRGVRSLLSSDERAKLEQSGAAAAERATRYAKRQQQQKQQQQQQGDVTSDATARILRAQRERHARMAEDRADEDGLGGSPVSMLHLDAKFAQMERAGEFKDLAGVGKPLAERHATHFGGEDALDRMLERIMAENNVLPESVERRRAYLGKLGALRERIARSVEGSGEGAQRFARARCEAEIRELRALRKAFDDAAVKDSLTYGMPILKLPEVGELEEEVARARKGGG